MLDFFETEQELVVVTDGWLKPESLEHKGLLVRRASFEGAWDDRLVDGFGGISVADARFGGFPALRRSVANSNDNLSARLLDGVGTLLAAATLPRSLSEQIRSDACSIGRTV